MDWFQRRKDDSDSEDKDRSTGPLGAPAPVAEPAAPSGMTDRDTLSADLVERLRATGLAVSDVSGAEELMTALEAEDWVVILEKRSERLYVARASKRGAKSKQGRRLPPTAAISAGKTPVAAVAKIYLKLHPQAPGHCDPAGS
jgi:hypothetical protein